MKNPHPNSIVDDHQDQKIPLWIKIGFTLIACVVIPLYLWKLGAKHLLWLSDIALVMTVIALWRESPLLNSMVAVGILPMELIWDLDFFGRILIGGPFLHLTEYMFDATEPIYFRSLSLFHVLLPFLVIFLLFRWGYDRRALWLQFIFSATIVIVTYVITGPEDNINWVYGPGTEPQTWVDPVLYLISGMIFLFIFVMLPAHFLLKKWIPS